MLRTTQAKIDKICLHVQVLIQQPVEPKLNLKVKIALTTCRLSYITVLFIISF